MNIYVGNLSFEVTEADLRQAFESFGEVTSAKIIQDKYSGRPRGFAFVEMPVKDQGEAAVTHLDGTDLQGRKLKVNEARPRSGGGRQGAKGPGGGRRGGRRQGGGFRNTGRSA